MGKPNYNGTSNTDLTDAFMDVVGGIALYGMWIGAVVSIASFAMLLVLSWQYTAGGAQVQLQAALDRVEILHKGLLFGLLGFGVFSAVVWWKEPKLPIIQVAAALIVVLAPTYLPLILGNNGDPNQHPVFLAAYQTFQSTGSIFAVIAAVVLIIDVGIRIRERASFGMKADQLKYGKGIKEEGGRSNNVFMGKCWQLPYCRKFVRERCPIYHAKRSCWREKVGCMCEEEVIRNAMENRAIPKDAVAAAKYIPVNNKLTLLQKQARCRQCVIYNEHQKHKYRLGLAALNVGWIAFVAISWRGLLDGMSGVLKGAEDMYRGMTFQNPGIDKMLNSTHIPQEILLVAILLICFTYTLKILEFLIFKIKI